MSTLRFPTSDSNHTPNGSLAHYASAYVAAGLGVLPALRRGDAKRVALPAWKPYQSRLPSSDELDGWFNGARPASAMCLVCGAVSSNLEVIDFDLGGEAFEAWREAVEAALPEPGLIGRLVIESTPSGGKHVIYRCEGAVSGSTKLAQRRFQAESNEPVAIGAKEHAPRQDEDGNWIIVVTMIETRGEGGVFLCAPSDGYVLLQGDLCSPPVITADERDILLGCASALDEMPKAVVDGASRAIAGPTVGLRPGDDFNRRGDPRKVLIDHGWMLIHAGSPGTNEHWRRPGKSAGTSATLKDSVFYVFSTNAAPFEAQKGYSPFAVYALLEHHGDSTAAASGLAAKGYGQPSAVKGSDISAVTTTTPHVLEAVPIARPAPLTVGELVDAHPALRPPVIHGLLRQGETMNVIAAPKTGKSWLTLDLAIAVAIGRPWLGRYPTERGEVLIIDNELHRESSAHRIPKVAHARNVIMQEIRDRIHVDNVRGRLQDIFMLAPYFEALEPNRYKVVILDAFYRFMPAECDENDNSTMANIYNRIDSFADRLGCCFVLIHHSTKGSQAGKSVTDVGAGAGAQSRAADAHVVLRPHEDDDVVVLEAAVRSWQPVSPVCLCWSFPVWNVDESLDPCALKNGRPGKKKDAPKKADQPAAPSWDVERFVAEFITAKPVTIPELREHVDQHPDLPWRRAQDMLSIAETRGLVERRKLPGRGGPVGFVRAEAEQDGGAA